MGEGDITVPSHDGSCYSGNSQPRMKLKPLVLILHFHKRESDWSCLSNVIQWGPINWPRDREYKHSCREPAPYKVKGTVKWSFELRRKSRPVFLRLVSRYDHPIFMDAFHCFGLGWVGLESVIYLENDTLFLPSFEAAHCSHSSW